MGKQERSRATMELLVAAAAGEFAARGFVRATLADISRRAGVTKGALFFHFSTKDALADAVQARGRELLERVVGELLVGQERQLRLQVLVDATYVLNRLLREDLSTRASVRITRERQGTPSEPLDFYSLWLGRLWDLLDGARRNGELERSVADASAQALVTAAVSGIEALAWMGVSQREANAWLSGLWSLVMPLLAAEDSREHVRTTSPVR